ncbi:hypothetical protein Bbelb_016470 [Branchiostoma belcheri]|nr:hypothetical protein Bbelb_016470 [Branchiostoma belcheri]
MAEGPTSDVVPGAEGPTSVVVHVPGGTTGAEGPTSVVAHVPGGTTGAEGSAQDVVHVSEGTTGAEGPTSDVAHVPGGTTGAEGPTSDVVPVGTIGTSIVVPRGATGGLSIANMRAAVSLTKKIRKKARQVNSDGYKGDDEDDDCGMPAGRDGVAPAGRARTTAAAVSSGDADVEASAVADTWKDDSVAIRHPSDALPPPNTITPRNARDPSPTYNQNTPNSQNPNPMYSPNVQEQQRDSSSEPDLHSDNPSIQTEAASYQEDGQTSSGPAVGDDDDPFTQPYAVRYREEDDDAGITPYAVAYMTRQGDTDSTEQTDTKTPSSSDNDTDLSALDGNFRTPVQNAIPYPYPMFAQNALLPNQMYVPNPNPVPNAVHESCCECISRWVCAVLTTAVILPSQPLDTVHPTGQLNLGTPHTTGQPTPDTPHTTGQPNLDTPHTTGQSSLDTVFTTETYAEHFEFNAEPIEFGEEGTSPGQIEEPSGVAVSADNEIFLADVGNQRVQVFGMNGAFLRLFPTELPGRVGQAMYPTDVDIDGEGRVWVVGRNSAYSAGAVRVVQYGTDGLPVITFAVKRHDWYPTIAVNARYNRIIVVASGEVFKFRPSGTLEGSFGKKENTGLQYVTSDGDGNILVTDVSLPGVRVYDHTGRSLHSFRTANGDKGSPSGICMDPQGRIIVADSDVYNGRVDMYTSPGEFVRMVVNVTSPWGIALGPGGHLVVTYVAEIIVTIFPPWMVFPDEHFV